MRPILALNCLLQIEQEKSEEESSVGDALALALCCARFCSASLIVPRLFEEKWRDTVFDFPWCVVRGAWRVVRGSEFLVGTLSP